MTNLLPGMKERKIPDDRKDIYTFRPKSLEDLIDTLSPKEKLVIIHTYGLFGESPKKQKEISVLVGISRERVGAFKNKAIRKLFHRKRAVYFAFLPDVLMQDVFGNTNCLEIIKEFSPTGLTFSQMKKEILDSIEKKNEKYERFIDYTRSYLSKLDDTYNNFIGVLKGSNLKHHLNDINTMSMRLESQCVNMQSTLQIAHKFLSKDIKLPQTQIEKFFDEMSTCMLNLKELEDEFRRSIDYKNLIYSKNISKE